MIVSATQHVVQHWNRLGGHYTAGIAHRIPVEGITVKRFEHCSGSTWSFSTFSPKIMLSHSMMPAVECAYHQWIYSESFMWQTQAPCIKVETLPSSMNTTDRSFRWLSLDTTRDTKLLRRQGNYVASKIFLRVTYLCGHICFELRSLPLILRRFVILILYANENWYDLLKSYFPRCIFVFAFYARKLETKHHTDFEQIILLLCNQIGY